MNRIALLALLGALVLASSGVAGAQAPVAAGRTTYTLVVVPNVVGMRMDRATRALHRRGLRVNEECSGVFGCIVKARWWVCTQSPRAGARVAQLRIVVIYALRRGDC